MRLGVYGKLPAKRDFVSVETPLAFLHCFEPWLQSGIAASRKSLGPAWEPAFLSAPIWRFWLGPRLAGATVAGALMPSVDGVGRYFPLCLFAIAEAGEAIPHPDMDAQQCWFEAIETLLLSALSEEASFGVVLDGLQRLEPPAMRAAVNGSDLPGQSVWWTHGGPACAPKRLVAAGMPDESLFAGLLTGKIHQPHS